MDLVPILHAALKAVGGDPNADTIRVQDLEAARVALQAVDRHIGVLLGEVEIASVKLVADPIGNPSL